MEVCVAAALTQAHVCFKRTRLRLPASRSWCGCGSLPYLLTVSPTGPRVSPCVPRGAFKYTLGPNNMQDHESVNLETADQPHLGRGDFTGGCVSDDQLHLIADTIGSGMQSSAAHQSPVA